MDRAKVVVISTGGTIDSVGTNRLDRAWYADTGRRLRPEELLESLPELAEIAEVQGVALDRLPSSSITVSDWLNLARVVTPLVRRSDVTGLVVTHGTNTLEETAYFLDLVIRSETPVVVVGAMIPPSAIGTDSELNLVNAVRVAASKEARGRGVLVAMNDGIYAAREVTKVAMFATCAFGSPGLGPLGYTEADGSVSFYRTRVPAARQGTFDICGRDGLPRVDVVMSYAGADGVLIDAAVAAGAKGIVSAGSGAGRITPAESAALGRAAEQGVVVCQASRVHSGRVLRSPEMRQRGVVAAGNHRPWKARVLLMLALTQTINPDAVQEMFEDT